MMFGRLLWKMLRGSRGRLAVALVAVISGAAVISALLNLDFDIAAQAHAGIPHCWAPTSSCRRIRRAAAGSASPPMPARPQPPRRCCWTKTRSEPASRRMRTPDVVAAAPLSLRRRARRTIRRWSSPARGSTSAQPRTRPGSSKATGSRRAMTKRSASSAATSRGNSSSRRAASSTLTYLGRTAQLTRCGRDRCGRQPKTTRFS